MMILNTFSNSNSKHLENYALRFQHLMITVTFLEYCKSWKQNNFEKSNPLASRISEFYCSAKMVKYWLRDSTIKNDQIRQLQTQMALWCRVK